MTSLIKVNSCYLVKVVGIISLTAASFGMSLVATEELADYYKNQLQWTEKEEEDNVTWLSSATALGLMIGSLTSSFVIQIGRRKAILLAAIIQLAAGAFQFYIDFWVILAAKIVYAAMSAVMLTACAVYLAETLPPEKVGSHGFAVNLGVTGGISIVLLLGAFVDADSGSSWVVVALSLPVVSLLNLLIWFGQTEPLGYCIANEASGNYKQDALKVIRAMYHIGASEEQTEEIYQARKSSSTTGAKDGMRDSILNTSLDVKAEEVPNSIKVLTDPRYRTATLISIMIACFNQLSGLNALNFYSSVIFESVFEGNANSATIGTALTGIAQIIGVCISPFIGQRFELKSILIVGQGLCAFFMFLVALFAELIDVPIMVLVFILLFLIAFQATQGSFFFTYVAEVAEDAGVAWANFTIFCFVLMFAFITQDLFDALGNSYTFLLFGILNALGTIAMALTLKNFNGLSKTEKKQLFWPESVKSRDARSARARKGSYQSARSDVNEGDTVESEENKM